MKEVSQAFNSSVTKAFALLDCFTDEKPQWGVRELAHRLNAHQSTTYRLMATLSSIGVLKKDIVTDKYSLGLKLFELGHMVDINASIVAHTHPILLKVSMQITETVHLGIFKNDKVLMIDKVKGTKGLHLDSVVGSTSLAHCTGLGKVLLSGLSRSDFDRFIDNNPLPEETKFTLTSKTALSKEIEKISKRGYALDKEEKELGLICVAVPVYNNEHQIIAAISAAGPAQRFKQQKLREYVAILKSGAEEIRASIGNLHPSYFINH